MEFNETTNNQQLLESLIVDTYLSFCQKLKDPEAARTHTIFAFKKILTADTIEAFTRTNNMRNIIKSIFPSPDICKYTMVNNFIDMILQNPLKEKTNEIKFSDAIIVTNNSYGKNHVASAIKEVLEKDNYEHFSRFYKHNKQYNYRNALKESVTSEDMADIIANTLTNRVLQKAYQETENVSNKINNQYESQINNFQIDPYTLNQCKLDLLSREQQNIPRHDYCLDNLYVSMDLGNKKENQEDSAIILTHPQNPDFKMLVVADGMGGLMAGEEASFFITSQITNWFEHLDPQYFAAKNTGILSQCFNEEIQNINNRLYDTYRGNSSSTFVGCIVSEKETIVSHVGDSRAYIFKQGKLQQLTKDDSLCYCQYQGGIIKQKDDIRFHKDSNVVTKAMGLKEDITPHTSTIHNSDYDTLLLFSDGVTDCISDNQIKAITTHTDIQSLAKTLVDTAKTNNSYQNHLPLDTYYSNIPGGKDNMTAAVYDNRPKNLKEEGR